MQRFLHHFKLAMIVTGIAFVLMIVVGLIGVSMIVKSGGRNANERASMLGGGLATLTGIIVAPFWIYGAYEAGKERREALKKASTKSKATGQRKKSKSRED